MPRHAILEEGSVYFSMDGDSLVCHKTQTVVCNGYCCRGKQHFFLDEVKYYTYALMKITQTPLNDEKEH